MPRAYKHNNFFGSRDSEHLGRNRSKPATNDYSGGGAIDLTHAVLDGKIKNGMGILRPPGINLKHIIVSICQETS